VLPPRWTLGYLGSTMQYTEAPDAQAQLHQFVELLDRHDIPCDLFHLSSGYTSGADGKRYVFEWNRSRIPDPAEMVADFHRAGVRLAANIKPALLTSHPRFAELAQAGGFIQTADGSGPQLVRFWGGQAAYLDFTNPQARAWWQRRLSEALLALGIDATWNDNNEFEVWDDDARCHGFGSALPIGLIRPLQTLLMVHASYQAQLAAAPARRPYLITRAGCPGIQRYAQTWSGDNATSWNTLRYNIPMGLGAGLSGIANTGHDVGGFAGPRPDPELFVRWVQNGVCQPRFTIHSWNSDGSANEPWMYPEVLPLVRAAIRWRYRLIPYLYSLLFEAALSGQPLIRPLVYAYPDDEHCVDESFDFLLGPNLLVASVLEPGARQRTVYLPAGQDWCDFAGGDWYRGGTTATIAAPLERIPLLVPEGGILPLGEAGRGGTAADALRQVYVFPHRGEGLGQFGLIEDDGESLDYRQGAYSRVRLRVAALAGGIRLELDWMQRGYPLPYTQIEWVLPPGEMRPVQVDRQTDAWCDEDGRRHIRARLA